MAGQAMAQARAPTPAQAAPTAAGTMIVAPGQARGLRGCRLAAKRWLREAGVLEHHTHVCFKIASFGWDGMGGQALSACACNRRHIKCMQACLLQHCPRPAVNTRMPVCHHHSARYGHCMALRCMALHCMALRCMALTPSHCIALRAACPQRGTVALMDLPSLPCVHARLATGHLKGGRQKQRDGRKKNAQLVHVSPAGS